MIRKIDHIGIAVSDLDAQVGFYRDVLGIEFHGFEELPDRGLKVAVFLIGNVRIELLQSTSPDSAIAKYIEKKGEGIHHIAFCTDNAQGELDRLRQAGVQLIDETPKPGADGMQVAFLHPKSTFKVLMELCQK
ncbi:methylmalonyl-CoA epimerase [bacterium]|nr:methylmalonyl-CoA epimerase [candidate division CSSED10-310 bacterium]